MQLNTTNLNFLVSLSPAVRYLSPECNVTEINSEGLLCSSLKKLEDDETFYFEW